MRYKLCSYVVSHKHAPPNAISVLRIASAIHCLPRNERHSVQGPTRVGTTRWAKGVPHIVARQPTGATTMTDARR